MTAPIFHDGATDGRGIVFCVDAFEHVFRSPTALGLYDVLIKLGRVQPIRSPPFPAAVGANGSIRKNAFQSFAPRVRRQSFRRRRRGAEERRGVNARQLRPGRIPFFENRNRTEAESLGMSPRYIAPLAFPGSFSASVSKKPPIFSGNGCSRPARRLPPKHV